MNEQAALLLQLLTDNVLDTKHPNIIRVTRSLEMVDGTVLSIQASTFHFCTPKTTLPYDKYSHFEVYSSKEMPALDTHEDMELRDNIYQQVPVETLITVITQCGGISHVIGLDI